MLCTNSMRKYTVIVTDDVEDYFIELMRFVASKYTMDSAIRYAKRIRMEIEELSYLAPMLPRCKYDLLKLYHPEAKTLVVGNKKPVVKYLVEIIFCYVCHYRYLTNP